MTSNNNPTTAAEPRIDNKNLRTNGVFIDSIRKAARRSELAHCADHRELPLLIVFNRPPSTGRIVWVI